MKNILRLMKLCRFSIMYLSYTVNLRYIFNKPNSILEFPGGSVSKESTCNAGDLSSIPGLGRSPGEEHSNPLQYSCWENSHRQRSLAGYTPWGWKESDTTKPRAQHNPALAPQRVLPTAGGAAGTSAPAQGRGANPSLLDPPQGGSRK